MELYNYRTNDIHDLRIVDAWLSQSTEHILTKKVFCELMENGVITNDKTVVIEGYHLCRNGIEEVKREREHCKNEGKKYKGTPESSITPITMYERSWRIFNSRISQRLQALSQYVERSTENGTPIPSKGNSYTYRYKLTGFSIKSILTALSAETTPELMGKEYESPLSGRRKTVESLSGRQPYADEIVDKLQKAIAKTDIDEINGEKLRKTFANSLQTLSDRAKKEIDKGMSELCELIKNHPDNWKVKCVELFNSLIKKSSLLYKQTEQADILICFGNFLVACNIYEGAEDLFKGASDIYSAHLNFNCTNRELWQYISIYNNLASLYLDYERWNDCAEYASEGIRLIEGRKNDDNEMLLLWLSLRNYKTWALLYDEKTDEAIEMAEESMAFVRRLDIERRNLWSAKRMLHSYSLLAECYLTKAREVWSEDNWRKAWDFCDEAVAFNPGETPKENDFDYQEKMISLSIKQMRVYIDIPRAIYQQLTREDWDRIHAFDVESHAFQLIEIIKLWDDFSSDGTPSLPKALCLGMVNECMIQSCGSFKEFLKDETVNSYIESEEYILTTYELYAHENVQIYGSDYGNYLVSSVKIMSELFFTVPLMSQFAKRLDFFYEYVISCMYRLVDAHCIANMLENDDSSDAIDKEAEACYWELVSICEEYNLQVCYNAENDNNWFETIFYLDTLQSKMEADDEDGSFSPYIYNVDLATQHLREIATAVDPTYNDDLDFRFKLINDYRESFGLQPFK